MSRCSGVSSGAVVGGGLLVEVGVLVGGTVGGVVEVVGGGVPHGGFVMLDCCGA